MPPGLPLAHSPDLFGKLVPQGSPALIFFSSVSFPGIKDRRLPDLPSASGLLQDSRSPDLGAFEPSGWDHVGFNFHNLLVHNYRRESALLVLSISQCMNEALEIAIWRKFVVSTALSYL